MKKNILFASVLSLLFASCSNDSGTEVANATDPIKFTGTVTNLKVTGAAWDAGDQISIMMKKAGSTLLQNTLILEGNPTVALYKTPAGDGIFTPDGESNALYYPTNGASVDFVAFYPYSSGAVAQPIRLNAVPYNVTSDPDYNPAGGLYILSVDLDDQVNQENLDLLYSNNLTNRSANNMSSQLQFVRKMSKVEFNISAGEGLSAADLIDLNSYFYGPSNSGVFNLSSGKFDRLFYGSNDIQGKPKPFMIGMKDSENGRFAEATLFPEQVAGQNMNGNVNETTRVEFRLKNGEVYTWNLPNGIKFEEGKRYIYNITIKKTNTGTKVAVEINQATITDWDTAANQNVVVE